MLVGCAQALTYPAHQGESALFMGDMARPLRFRGQALAQIVQQGGEANVRCRTQAGCLLQYQQGVQAAVDLRMVLRALRHAEQGLQLR